MMLKINSTRFVIAAFVIAGFVLFVSSNSQAQDKMKKFYIQAQAMGTAQQMGQNRSVTLIVENFATEEERQALIGAFKAKGNEGLVNALSKMRSIGRLSITGTLGFDVKFIRMIPMPDGSTKYRIVTDRPILFGEAWSDSRSADYNLSAMEVIVFPKGSKGKKNSGTLLPACQFTLDKDNQIEIELRRNPFNLVNIQQR